MASACFFARCASLPARLVAHPTPLAITSCRLRRLGAEGARPVCAAGRMLGSVRYGTGAALGPKEAGAEVAAVPPSVPVVCAAGRMLGSVRYGTGAALGPKEAGAEVAAVPPSVPVRVAYELQLAGHRYLDVRTEGEFGGGHPAGAVNIPYMHSTGSATSKSKLLQSDAGMSFRMKFTFSALIKFKFPLAGMAKNSGFLEQVSAIFRREDEIIIGYTGVTDIAGGYSAWKENELPINQ
uniref:Uncharacterized protein n=1 Tax=Aegilops tauschii TaxID=37682 RepID=M8C547_AEGTA